MSNTFVTTKTVATTILAIAVLAGCSKGESPTEAAGADQVDESPSIHAAPAMDVAEFYLDASAGVTVDKNASLDK